MKKLSTWTYQEDKLLLEFYSEVDCFQKWKYISQKLAERGFSKNEIQCRERYVNKLNPDLRHDRLEKSEVLSLFQYYDQYGPLWSVFESLIPGRSQNLLKNKFYSTLRSLVRILFSCVDTDSDEIQTICSASLSSKLLVEIYEGKKNFRKYKGLLSSLLQKLDFQLDVEKSCFIKNQINLKVIKNLKIEILNSIESNTRTKKNTRKPITQKNEVETSNKTKQNSIAKQAELPDETFGKANQAKQSPKTQTSIEHLPPFSFYLAPINPYALYFSAWGYPTQN